MKSGPTRTAERMVSALLPPSRRQEVLGDLHERYRSPSQYALDALKTVPFVLLSQLRRKLFYLRIERENIMSLKVLAAILIAFMCGAAAGVIAVSNPTHFLLNSLPFLILLAFWVVLMGLKLKWK